MGSPSASQSTCILEPGPRRIQSDAMNDGVAYLQHNHETIAPSEVCHLTDDAGGRAAVSGQTSQAANSCAL
jgi:hypothetical protein